jgi:hypothetical protein
MADLIDRQSAIDALDEIRHALWEIDIPSPTVPEYIEHHEQIQSVWKLLDKKQKELYILPPVQLERQKGKWIDYTEDGYVECPFCHSATNCDGNKDELHFCFSCGADMREVVKND